jgi:hypothetical protein
MSWSDRPGSGLHLLTNDGLLVINRSRVPLIVGSYYRPPNRTDNEYVNNSINELSELCTGSSNATVTNIFYICDVMILVLQVYITVIIYMFAVT